LAVSHSLTRTDAAGNAWMLGGRARWGKLGRFRVGPGETFAVQAGAPLVGTADVGPPKDGIVEIDYMFLDRDGERYSAQVVVNGAVRQLPPSLRILDESGQVLATGQFEYG
jgi:hypothetical protein